MAHPQIARILRDQNYREQQHAVKKKEAQIAKRDAELKLREEAVKKEMD